MSKNGGEKKPWDPEVEHIRKEPRPQSLSEPLPRTKLPKELQATLDDDEKLWEVVYEGRAGESTDSSVRYAGYAARFRTILLAAHRYVAYTSDIGESFRPVAHPIAVRAAYGISWAYIGGDVLHEGYKAYVRNQKILHPEKRTVEDEVQLEMSGKVPEPALEHSVGGTGTLQGVPGKVRAIDDYRTVMAQRAVFQSIASMGLPAFTIHSIVKYSGKAMRNVKNVKLRTWGPIGLGLSAVPALPYLFDQPVEHATEWLFHTAFRALGGPEAVGERPGTSTHGTVKEKEL
ncbi:uncharacterized protein PV09_03202 [Verruconis gallopava]|uniref:Mitochondrial fission process protein 1 n=1 Tax=Verruconis gallopava TaxID=253628 RepID=A0A0D2AGI4_9PEZI|nr:uncharacterized protein PV09_03202 [Verruconis gallopava]KIW06023.1 hypothetical protein PV09_03202 [Verruconis gallopava]